MEDRMDRYFVVILAPDAAALRALQAFEFDVFPQTARGDAGKDFGFTIDGLLTMEEIERLVKEGYRVHIEDAAERRARGAENVIEFPEWLQRMQTIMRRERAAAKKAREPGSGKK
jgi:hypothetical protein